MQHQLEVIAVLRRRRRPVVPCVTARHVTARRVTAHRVMAHRVTARREWLGRCAVSASVCLTPLQPAPPSEPTTGAPRPSLTRAPPTESGPRRALPRRNKVQTVIIGAGRSRDPLILVAELLSATDLPQVLVLTTSHLNVSRVRLCAPRGTDALHPLHTPVGERGKAGSQMALKDPASKIDLALEASPGLTPARSRRAWGCCPAKGPAAPRTGWDWWPVRCPPAETAPSDPLPGRVRA